MTLALHGFLGAPAMWAGLEGELVAPWSPGHGPSPAPLEQDDFNAVVDALAARYLPVGGARVVGYSLGGRLALALALRHPARVREAVLIGATPGLKTEAERRARRASDEALAESLFRDGLVRFVDAWEALPLFATQRALPVSLQARRRAERLGHTVEGLAGSLRVLGTGAMPSLWDALPGCEVPLRWVTGALDEKFTAIAREACAVCPAATHTVVPGAGHDVVLERGVGEVFLHPCPLLHRRCRWRRAAMCGMCSVRCLRLRDSHPTHRSPPPSATPMEEGAGVEGAVAQVTVIPSSPR
ncbi:MAG: alpha/beta fold hydrolase [Polyangiales bacterium]